MIGKIEVYLYPIHRNYYLVKLEELANLFK